MEYSIKKYDHFTSRAKRFIAIAGIVCLLQLSATANRPLFDFTGDQRTDFTYFPPFSTGTPLTWRTLRNPGIPGPGNAFIRYTDWGLGGDSIRAGNYSGDSKTELVVRRSGVFYEAPFPETAWGPVTYVNWGLSTDTSAGGGDYDGDGKDDYTVVRVISSQLNWWIKLSSGGTRVITFGALGTGLTAVLLNGADFNGDGRDELVFARYPNSSPAPVTYYVGDSVTGAQILQVVWGDFNTMISMPPADYTGDGKADFAAVQLDQANLSWWIRNTATGQQLPVVKWGLGDPAFINFDYPLRGDYDGDGIADIAVWRPSTQGWWWINSSAPATIGFQQWGSSVDDFPLPALGTF